MGTAWTLADAPCVSVALPTQCGCCRGRLALIQEGGYALSYAALCLHATLAGVLGRELGISDPLAYLPDPTDGIEARIDDLARRWRLAASR